MRHLLFLPLVALATSAFAADPDGAAVYKRCAACHLASKAGVPGAFPPLKGEVQKFAAKPDGRRYLVLVVTRGLSGSIKAEGKTYMGMMPAQSMLSDAEVAAVLNHVTSHAKAFSADEVAKLRASGASLSPADVAKLNAKLVN